MNKQGQLTLAFLLGVIVAIIAVVSISVLPLENKINDLEKTAVQRGYAQFKPDSNSQPSYTVFSWK